MVYQMLIVTNQASHSYGARLVVDRGIKEHEAIRAFSNPTIIERDNLKIVKVLYYL